MRIRLPTGLCILLAVLGLVGCSTGSVGNPTAPKAGHSTRGARPSNGSSSNGISKQNNSGPVGTTFTANDGQGHSLKVTLVKVIDPAKGSDQFTTPDHGKRFVGARFRLVGVKGHYSDDANTDATIIGSNHQTYQPDFNDIKGCTNFNDGSYSLTPGEKSIGCVVFQAPNHVKVKQVQWSATGGFGGAPATWNL